MRTRPLSGWVVLIERAVQQQHVDSWRAQEPERAARGVLLDEGLDLGRADVPGGSDSVHLDGGVGLRDLRVEARGGSRDGVGRDLRDRHVVERGDLLLPLLDELDLGRVVRSQVRRARVQRVAAVIVLRGARYDVLALYRAEPPA